MKFIKKLTVTLLLFLVLAGGVLMVLPKLVPMTRLDQLVKGKVREATGRELAFTSARLVFFPDVAIALENATFSNASWAKDKNMLEVGRLDVAVALTPLFQKRIEVKRFVLKAPVIHLEKNTDGRGNWEFSPPKKQAAAGSGSAASSSAAPAGQGFQFRIGAVRIEDGALSFADRAKGTTEKVGALDVEVKCSDLSSPLHVDGSLTYKGRPISLTLDVEKPRALMEGASSRGAIAVKTADLSAKVNGQLSASGVMLRGDIDASVSSLSKLVAWATGAAEKKLPFENVSFKSAAELSASAMKLSGAALSLDDVSAKGDVTVALAGRPGITARVSLGKLALDRFAGGADEEAKAASGMTAAMTPPPAKAKAEGWDTTPIDFSGMKSVDADLVLDTEGFSLKGAEAGPSRLTVILKNGVLSASSSETTLFGGTFSSALSANAAAATPALGFKFLMSGVEAKPVLETFADFKKLSGTADANIDVTGAGNSQAAIIGSLAGKGAVTFKNGALEGIDLVDIMKMIQNRLATAKIGEGKTDFVEMGGTFTVANGVAHNADFAMKGPLVQATGAGDIDLPRQYVRYRVLPVLTASSGAKNATGLSVPVDIKGPFSDIRVLPDYNSVIKDAIKDPSKIRGQVKDIAKQAKPILQQITKDPAAAIQSILNGGIPGLTPPPQQEPASPAQEQPRPEGAQ